MTHHTTRRALLCAAPALAATPFVGLASAAPAAPVDPIIEIAARYHAWCAEWNRLADLPGNGDFDWPESLHAEAMRDGAIEELCQTRPTSVEGLAAMIAIYWAEEGPGFHKQMPPESEEPLDYICDRLLRSILRSAEAMTS